MTTDDGTGSQATLREFVRTRGADFLADPNITSVGVGYKITGGRVTDEIALQFTVREKVEPARLGQLGSRALPASLEIGGRSVPTDVVERRYTPAYLVVAGADADIRRSRVDPVMPGVSVGHPSVSAGTLGCIVYGRDDATPYALSNWHVLHGPSGTIGDHVLQPGPHDDNRVGRNRMGRLVRSHLGAAGDCAIASIDTRRIEDTLLGLGVSPEELGDAELGDKVVKSGRTTGVTHGVVVRIDVLARIDYGAAGERQIGGIEIGPDPADPAPGGEISDGGDSGAVWMFRAGDGGTSHVMAGLHFGGEAPGVEADHALACLPRSVFDRLGITLSRRQAEARVAENRQVVGYDPAFLAAEVALPQLTDGAAADAVEVDGSAIVPYTHFSLTMSRSRRFARWVAWNVDGANLRKLPRSRERFRLDPRVPEEAQVGDELYTGNRVDRGHVARRADLAWGPEPEAQQANSDSFFFTNITPQVDDFNQSGRQGVWGRLEDTVYEQVEVQDLRISVFGGPVFAEGDPTYRGVRLPREYWKVIGYVEAQELRARAFLLSQDLDRLEALDLDEFRTYQVTLAEITERTGVVFPAALGAGAPEEIAAEAVHAPLEDVTDVRW